MNINDIIALAHAGFTAEQISKMVNIAPAPAPAPAPTPAPAPAPAPAPTPAPAPAPEQDYFAQIMSKLSSMQTAIQANNVHTLGQPIEKSLTTDDILASIINPMENREKGLNNG